MAHISVGTWTGPSYLVILICEIANHNGQQVLWKGVRDCWPVFLAEQGNVRHLLHQLCPHGRLCRNDRKVSGCVLPAWGSRQAGSQEGPQKSPRLSSRHCERSGNALRSVMLFTVTARSPPPRFCLQSLPGACGHSLWGLPPEFRSTVYGITHKLCSLRAPRQAVRTGS